MIRIICVLCATVVAGFAATNGPAIRFTFDDDRCTDSSGNGFAATASGAETVAGTNGRALALNGSGGLLIDTSDKLNLSKGFTVDCFVRFDDLARPYTIAARKGEFMLRMEGENSGSIISFWIPINNALEPRVRGIKPEPGRWHRITASWDRREMKLFIDRQEFRAGRAGKLESTANPIIIGGAANFGYGVPLRGAIDEFMIYDRPATEADLYPDETGVDIKWFLPACAVARAGRPLTLIAQITNRRNEKRDCTAALVLPPSVAVAGASSISIPILPAGGAKNLSWKIRSESSQEVQAMLGVRGGGIPELTSSCTIRFTEPVPVQKAAYVPEPRPVQSSVMLGFLNCPLWDSLHASNMWGNVTRDPRRWPALGAYAEENPEVKDWETKFTVEHGGSFMLYCWYRTNAGFPPTTPASLEFGGSIHEGLLKSRYRDKIKFSIMWVNNSKKDGAYEVRSADEFLNDVVPFWIAEYFRHPSYLVIDNKPVVAIFDSATFARNLGGIQSAAETVRLMRAAVRRAGFADVILLGHARMPVAKMHEPLRDMGFDYAFSYNWVVPGNPSPEAAVEKQIEYWKKTKEMNILPHIISLTVGWTGWGDEASSKWRLPPAQFKTLCEKAKAFISKLPRNELGSRMILIDNWNEYGEGHWIAPTFDYGFGHLDAIRDVFTTSPGAHIDLVPEDVGLGPYDAAFRATGRVPAWLPR